jgi:hypothetical protein
MRVELGPIPPEAERWLPENEPDASGLGVNYADVVLKLFKKTLDDGRKITCKRRGLKLTLTIGDHQGESLMRRVEHGPDVRDILNAALAEAAGNAGATFTIVDDVLQLEVE